MNIYYFLLGQNSKLSFAELQAVLGDEVDFFNPTVAMAQLENDQVAIKLIEVLGGVVKIFSQIEALPLDTKDVEDHLVESIATKSTRSFALAEIGRDHLPTIEPSKIKKLLTDKGVKARFVEGSRHGLSAAVLIHKTNILEIALIQSDDQLVIANTVAVQDIDQWTFRDRSKPYSDHKKGMLPPKVARMMLNLGLANYWQSEDITKVDLSKVTVYDPFCGSGTILLEAMQMGARAIGSDVDEKAVIGSQRNLEWFASQTDNKSSFKVFKKDVAAVDLIDINQKVELIITEPFLGRQTPSREFLPKMFLGLEKLYLGAFKKWTKILTDNADIVIIFPFVEDEKRVYDLSKLIDKLTTLGYTLYLEPNAYFRPDARVKRQILHFKYQKNNK